MQRNKSCRGHRRSLHACSTPSGSDPRGNGRDCKACVCPRTRESRSRPSRSAVHLLTDFCVAATLTKSACLMRRDRSRIRAVLFKAWGEYSPKVAHFDVLRAIVGNLPRGMREVGLLLARRSIIANSIIPAERNAGTGPCGASRYALTFSVG